MAERLAAMRQEGSHKTTHGRLIYNGIRGAAVSKVDDDVPRADGFIQRVANVLGQHTASIWEARLAEQQREALVDDDPSRETRGDALDMQKVREA